MLRTTAQSQTPEFNSADGESKLLVPLLAAFVLAELILFYSIYLFWGALLTKIK